MKTAFFILLVLLTSCASVKTRNENADAIAARAGLEKTVLEATFKLRAYQRISNSKEANIYIEGDGLAWLTRSQQSLNPTPTNPVALKLAAADSAANVIYLGRPCQYLEMDKKCSAEYWGSKRFAPEVIEAYMQALDSYGFTAINLIGYSGGGGIATILAAKRNDVVSLRTVAGNVDTEAFSNIHDISKLDGSINPAHHTADLVNKPQIHFIGQNDKIITPAIFSAFPENQCTRLHIIPDTGHEDQWPELWAHLLKEKPYCN